jgi:tetratricopeptide (TPR) repeat protein
MKHATRNSKQFELNAAGPKRTPEGPVEYLFDDEPLDRILYGDSGQEMDCAGPTRANLFFPAVSHIKGIEQLLEMGLDQEAIDKAAEIGAADNPLPAATAQRLLFLLDYLFPNHPKPVVRGNVGSLGILLEKLWDLALESKNEVFVYYSGTKLYRWYEYQRRFDDARHIVGHLMEQCRMKGLRQDEAVMINNYGFDYLLEERWDEAIPYFETAAGMFEECGDGFNHANARANYWTCFVESRLSDIDEVHVEELRNLAEILKCSSSWHRRKPLISLARVEERRGNLTEAVKLVEQAIALADDGKITYPDEDRLYLAELMHKMNAFRSTDPLFDIGNDSCSESAGGAKAHDAESILISFDR